MKMKTEDDWIKYLQTKSKSLNQKSGALSIGDDAAVFKPSRRLRQVVCSDSLLEGVHFDLEKISWEDLGWKSLAVNLSDLAAMGARPRFSLLNLSLPKRHMGEPLKEFLKGYLSLSRKHKVALLGGDTTKSLRDFFISVTVMGEVSSQNLKLRSKAKPKDLICVSSFLGDSASGFFLQNQTWNSLDKNKLLKAHHHPTPQVELGQWLGTQEGVHAMMDLSDGLAQDLFRLCESSGVSAVVDGSQIPMSSSLKKFGKHFSKNPLAYALGGGEDYQLLFTCSKSEFYELKQKAKRKFNQRISSIGEISKRDSKQKVIRWINLPQKFSVQKIFEHF